MNNTDSGEGGIADTGDMTDKDTVNDVIKQVYNLCGDSGQRHHKDEPPHFFFSEFVAFHK